MLQSKDPITVTNTAEEEGIRPVIVAGICRYNSFGFFSGVFIAFYNIRGWSFSAVRWPAALLWLKVHFSRSGDSPTACGLSEEPTGRPPMYRYFMNLKRMHELSTKQQTQHIHSHFRGCAEDPRCLLESRRQYLLSVYCSQWNKSLHQETAYPKPKEITHIQKRKRSSRQGSGNGCCMVQVVQRSENSYQPAIRSGVLRQWRTVMGFLLHEPVLPKGVTIWVVSNWSTHQKFKYNQLCLYF